jgi:hypothetical protein
MATIEEIKILLEQAQCKLALLQQLEQALSQCAEIEQHKNHEKTRSLQSRENC